MTENRDDGLRILIIGAHPDDADIKAGGVAALYARAGHTARLVSLTNGDAGHFEMGGAPLAWRRRAEAEASGSTLGCEYTVLDHHDGTLQPTLAVRNQVIRLVRAFRPDLVICPRPWDYHPDHRATGEVVVDALYMSTVPNVVSDVAHLRRMPVAAYMWDAFTRPYPLTPDVVVAIDDVVEQKIDALACHESQVFEWLPYNRSALDDVPEGRAARRDWLGEWYRQRFTPLAERYREALVARYGQARADGVEQAEVFEISEYGSPLTPEGAQRLFPF
jgi:LmbE family N-acetylglucosaminyl deacetylase